MPDMLKMPLDLQALLPPRPTVWLLLVLDEEQRAERLRGRVAQGLPATEEEKDLQSFELRQRLLKSYRALTIGEERLVEVDASGSKEEVLARVQEQIAFKLTELKRHNALSIPESVNWHFLRSCNYSCGFCFHTAKTSFCLPSTKEGLEDSKRCLSWLRDAGMQKLNFSGGEPFLQAKALGKLVRFCKEVLHLDSVTIVSNGSRITEAWMQDWGQWLDIIAISCDSFKEETNVKIGRGKGEHLQQVKNIKNWCKKFDVLFKINTVVNAYNVHEAWNQ